MPFWTSALSEPKRAHRFLLSLPNLVSPDEGYQYEQYLAKMAKKPSYTINSIEHKPDVQEDVFTNPSQAPGTINKADSVSALGNVIIQELSGQGGLVGEWTLNNAFILSATFGDLDYGSDDILNIDISMQYDWAEYVPGPAVAAAAGA